MSNLKILHRNNNISNRNLLHMRVDHSFFVSDIKYVTDLAGLLRYLGGKIHKGCLCIMCENHQAKDFKSGEAVQKHMIDKGHCFMKNDVYDEYIKYYDFTPTLNEYRAKFGNDDEKETKENLKENETYLEIISDDENDEENNEWDDVDEEDEEDEEDDDEEDEEDENDGKHVEENKKENQTTEAKKPRVHRIKVKKAIVLTSGEVQLPNGKIIGHRDYKRYYNQYFKSAMVKSHLRELMPSYNGSLQLATLNTQNQSVRN